MQENINLFEQRILEFFSGVISSIDKYSHKYKIEDFKLELVENDSWNLGVNGAIAEHTTITKDLNIDIKLNDESIKSYTLKIPVPVEDLFVVGGNVRLNLNYIDNNNVCKVTEKMLILDGSSYMIIHSRRPGEEEGLYIKTKDENSKHWVASKVDEIQLDERDPRIAKKLKILFDLDDEPTVIDMDLFMLIRSRYKLELRDNICNKEFVTTKGMFFNHLFKQRGNMISTLRSKFYRHGNFEAGYVQSCIDAFFNLQSMTSVGIQTPNNINPITYNSLKNKVILSRNTDKDVAFTRINESFTDFVDMVITPDNKNVNRINELTTAIVITDDGTFVKCYDHDFNLIEVPFLDYLASRVLTADQVDYENKEVHIVDMMTYKLGGIRKTSATKVYDYIELESDLRMSKSVQMIPMLNHSDSVRGSMGSRMLGQSIEVVGCEKPIVSSGHESFNSGLSVVAPENGVITGIDKGIVILQTSIMDDNGDYITYKISKPKNLESMYGINISFNTRVHLGQTVMKGDLIYSPNSIDDDNTFNFGINCKIAMMSYRGYTYEDGLVVSRSMARRFAHMSVEDVEIIIGPTMKIDGIKIPSQDMLKSGVSLCDYQIKLDKLSNSVNRTRVDFLGDQYYYKPCQLTVPLGITEAYLVDSMVIVGDIPSDEEETIHQVETVMGFNNKSVDPPVNYDYNKLTLNDFDSSTDFSYKIKFRLVVVNHLAKGDKITNRYGSKGIVSLIEDDENLPKLPDGTIVDCVMNPAAVVSRKNLSQTMELYLSNFSLHIKAKCNSMLSTGVGTLDDVRNLLTKYHYNQYASLSDDDLLNVIQGDDVFQIITGVFSKISIEDIISWYQEEGLEIGTHLIDGKTGRKIRKPVIVGEMYMMKLYQLATKKAQVTVDHSIKPKFVLGIGKESSSGLKTGTMEMDALAADNLIGFTRYIDGNDNLKSAWFLAHMVLAGLGLRGVDED